MSDFTNLGINENIVNVLAKENILVPTPIQEGAIPLLKEGYDVIGQAQTGTGKTFAYAIPLIEKIDPEKKYPVGLVLTPTRELGIQVSVEIDKLLSNNDKIHTACIYGGESYDKQRAELARHPQIIIGTPGRIIDQMNRKNLDFSKIEYLVLDEADEMLKMGFEEDLETILSTMPKERQTALFSATIPPFVKNVTKKYMKDPKWVTIEAKTLTVEAITQQVYFCKKDSKKDLMVRLLDYNQFSQIMVFCNTKAMVDELTTFLQKQGFRAEGLHGDLKQVARDKVMQSFRNKTMDILIATDVAARGIDIEGIDAVFNYDIPNENELYVHRIGRTGRAGSSGTAITIATSHSKSRISELERFTKSKMIVMPIPTPKEISSMYQKKLYLKICDAIEANRDNHSYDSLLMHLARGNSDPMPLLNALVSMVDENKNREYPEIQVFVPKSDGRRDRGDYRDRKGDKKDRFNDRDSYRKDGRKSDKTRREDRTERAPSDKGFAAIEVNIGRRDNIRPNQLVVYFHDELKIHREHFGKIIIDDDRSYVEVHQEALRFFRDLKGHKFNNHEVWVRFLDKMPK